MNTCKTCFYWAKDKRESFPNTEHRGCLNEKLHGCYLGSDLDGLDDNADADYGLSTGPNFGCIHHESNLSD